jgi:hypothetical protein
MSSEPAKKAATRGSGKPGHDRDQRVAEHVLVEQAPAGDALRAGYQHVLLAISSTKVFLVSSVIVAKEPMA